jgi:hypothetical protein
MTPLLIFIVGFVSGAACLVLAGVIVMIAAVGSIGYHGGSKR